MNKGFTLIETLFVLFIICMLSIISLYYHPISKSSDMIIKEISEFFYEAKITAMLSKKTVTVHIGKEISYENLNQKKVYSLPDEYYFDKHELSFNAYGNINKSKTLQLHYKEKIYRFVYQIGSGCFYVIS